MNPKDKIHSSWQPLIDILDKDEKLKELRNTVLPNCKYYPEREDIFNVFQMPLQDIKVVILGQDPYPNERQAIGYAFAVCESTPKPVSLRIIEKEVGSELDRTLLNWRQQGVFLLNTALTVEAKKAGSHLKYWEDFIKETIKFISIEAKPVWLLWGAKAHAYIPNIEAPFNFDQEYKPSSFLLKEWNVYIKTPHPAAEAYSSNAGFIGSKCFLKVNEVLTKQEKETINF